MIISILLDDTDSWITPYINDLIKILKKEKHKVYFCNDYKKIKKGDCAFFLGCGTIVPKHILKRNIHNLVVHESNLPKGKGWSPLTWQILEGKNKIPITIFEAVEKVDSGQIYFQDYVHFEGTELINELREKQGKKTIDLVFKFIKSYPNVIGQYQKGRETFYPRRKPEDSKIDPNKSIVELFNNFRVADNEKYPVFFEYLENSYILKIERKNNEK